MAARFFALFRTLHAWSGAALSLLVLLTSITGLMLVWKQDYLRLSIPEARVDFTPSPEALADIAATVENQFDNDDILLIQLPTENFPLAKVTLTDVRYAYVDIQGNIIDQWVQNERWEEWLYDLHHRLLLENTGLLIVGLGGLAVIIVVAAGIIAFWPFRRRFRRGFLPAGSSRPHLLAAHHNIGIVTALPLIIILATGVILAFPAQTDELLVEPFRGEEYSTDFGENVDDISGGDSGDWLPAMERAQAVFPEARIRSVQVPNFFSPYRIIGLQQPGELHPQGLSRVYIDARDGYMDIRIDAKSLPMAERLYNAGLPLHTGRIDSLFYKVLLTFVGLLATILSLFGLTAFIKRWI